MAIKNESLATVTGSTWTDLVQPAASATMGVFSITICNYAGTSTTVRISITNSSDTLKAYILYDIDIADKDAYFIDTKYFLDSQDKIRVYSTQANVSFTASIDEI